MGILLYDLAGRDPERRFSPYCWRIKLALCAKRKPLCSEQLRDEDVLARQPPLREALLKMVSQEGVNRFSVGFNPVWPPIIRELAAVFVE
jgi:hypothetical protein